MIDKEGKIILPIEYDSIEKFSEGLAEVIKDWESGYVDKEGRIVIPFRAFQIAGGVYFREGLTVNSKEGGGMGFIDKEGKEVIPNKYDYATNFSEGLAGVRKGEKWGFIDKEDREVIPFIYDDIDISGFSEGLAGVKK